MKNSTALNNESRGKFKYILLMCAVSSAINIAGALAARKFGIPLYLDTVGTVAAAALGGYMPGVLVGFITSLSESIIDAQSIYFISVQMVTALFAAYFANRGAFKSVLKSYAAVPALALAAGVLRVILTYVVAYPDKGVSGIWLAGYFNELIHSQTASSFAAGVVAEFADKAVVITLFVILIRLVPEKTKNSALYTYLWQAPLDSSLKKDIEKRKNRVISLRTKMVLIVVAVMVFMSMAAALISSVLFEKNTIEDSERLADGIAVLAAGAIDADKTDEYVEKGPLAEGYNETREELYKLRDSSRDIEYVYVYKIMEDGCHVVFDLDTEETKASEPGDIVDFEESFYPYLPALFAGEEIEPIISNDTFGWLLTVYKPVYDKNGVCRCYAAVDVSMNKLSTYGYSFTAKLLAILIGFLIFALVLGVWFIENNIILPVNTMSWCARAFAYDTDEACDKSVESASRLDIRTGDEIENLYNAFVKTISDSLKYIADIQHKTRTIAKMQNGLIVVLADMVENRDKNTGDHVRKTTAYAEAILEELQKRGVYTDQINEQFITDVINAATLHDIGKIHISDVILNKPGKLTDEEFDLMKQHTVYGSEIIDRVKDMVPDSGYLDEAKNITEYHHEKWNGTGYPHGLSGEDIPLSARVMAVADVFDALVSRRSYKEPFSFEKAMEIIKKDTGTHFDPEVTDAFFAVLERIKAISDKFIQEEESGQTTQPDKGKEEPGKTEDQGKDE